MLYAKINRDGSDTGERQEFAEPPLGPDALAPHKPYWVPIPKPPRTEGTFREFMALFTEAEQIAIKTAERESIPLALWMDRARGGATMRLEHPDTAAGMAALVVAGLITQARADEILAADFDA